MKTVTLPLEEYNYLLKFKEAIEGRKAAAIAHHGRWHSLYYTFLDNNEALEALAEEINLLQERIDTLGNKLAACKLEQEEFNKLSWYDKIGYTFNEQSIKDVLLRCGI